MNRTELTRRLREAVSQRAHDVMHQPVEDAALDGPYADPETTADLFVWFEDTRMRRAASAQHVRIGIAGLPESLLPWPHDHPGSMRVIERRYVDGHLHLLSAVRLRCHDQFGERIAALYTAALSVGTVAWIGTGPQYERAWQETCPPENAAGAQ
jgi:hypothetical protein